MTAELTIRRAVPEDVDAFLDHVQAGFDSYVEFAPPGWQPPQVKQDRPRTLELLSDAETWGLIALTRTRSAGHIGFLPAREYVPGLDRGNWRARPKLPHVAHLWQLFVMPEWWGRGLAAALHDAAVAEMSRRGFREGRLYTPAQHARARRFYERRGWSAAGEEWSPALNLVLTEYRRPLVP